MILAEDGSTDGNARHPADCWPPSRIAAHHLRVAPGKSNALKTSRSVTMRRAW